ncbi:MAG TPA: hypothetical protein VNT75_20975 [Symbiobacteriaceae bacterium]|nr:hypothetical protein [Symbiobacteriaceae bacterium]
MTEVAIQCLWVEDEPESVVWERHIARTMGWEVTLAKTAEAAAEALTAKRFDVVVLDLILPANDYTAERGPIDQDSGLKILAHIRDPQRVGQTPNSVKVLVFSCVLESATRRRTTAMLTSGSDYLTKGISDPNAISMALERINQELGAGVVPPGV